MVTSIKWNPRYNDLCAVGFGSYDFMRQGTGVICCYSLKNTRSPEYVFNTDAGICSLDWHPSHPAVLAVGLYDGTVLVYDVRARTKKPIYQSTVRTNKHTDPVWEVRWNNDASSGTLNFFSISSDGRVSNWFLMKNKLESEEVMELKLVSNTTSNGEDDETSLAGLAGCASTSTGRANTCSLSARRRAASTSVRRRLAGSTSRRTRATPWPSTPCAGTRSTRRFSYPRRRIGQSRCGTTKAEHRSCPSTLRRRSAMWRGRHSRRQPSQPSHLMGWFTSTTCLSTATSGFATKRSSSARSSPTRPSTTPSRSSSSGTTAA